ncbi:MAG TPA: EAL domain-containing protein [Acetobacteraceae bacterium]|nr:EAL domain-containing protein [Acetobacteraceae bacterium]
MHPHYVRQLAAATMRDGKVDLEALGASVSATYRQMDREETHDANIERLLGALKAQNERFEAALENMSQGLCFFDVEQHLILCNRRYAEMYGLRCAHVRPGTSLSEIIDRRYAAGSFPSMSRAEYQARCERIVARRLSHASVVELHDGRIIAIRHQPMPDGGWVSTHEDITAQRRAETRIAHISRHDSLTGLANRVLLREWLEEALAGARGARGTAPCALLRLGLDHFKRIHDTQGHMTGDALLRIVAERMRRLVRENGAIARIGGDEFAIVQSGVSQPAQAKALAARLVSGLDFPFEIGGRWFGIGASVGIAVAPADADADGPDADQLLRNADIALCRAKAEGRGCYRLFEPEMDALVQARGTLELGLRKALREEEFELLYQPLVHVQSRRLTGFEALIRWRHPERGLVNPGEFIPLAEEAGLVTEIDEWVLRAACREAAGWPKEVRVAVNLSAAHFQSGAVIGTVAGALAESGLRPDRLEIEITESMMIENSESALASLHRIHDLGARISMDDFGTGYSSLGYLRNFRFDKIKIDQSFIRELATRSDSIAIIRAITSLCDSLGMASTAEGVETEEQMTALVQEKCTEAQGYLFGRPSPASEIPALLRSLGPHLAEAA